MHKTATAAAAIVALAIAAPIAARTHNGGQHIRIEASGANTQTFVLTPMSAGPIQSDSGTLTFCCWTTSHVMRAGESLEVNDPYLTLRGAHGTLRLRNTIEWVDLPDGWSTFSGIWKAVSGTGAYRSTSGSGRVAGVSTANDFTRIRIFGSLTAK
jgi:hypothetical protein